MIDVAERSLAEPPQRLARHHQHVPAQDLLDPHAFGRDFLVRRGVLAERKQRRMLVGRNGRWRGDGSGGVHGELTGLGAGSVCFETPHRPSNVSKHFCEKWKLPVVSPGPSCRRLSRASTSSFYASGTKTWMAGPSPATKNQ